VRVPSAPPEPQVRGHVRSSGGTWPSCVRGARRAVGEERAEERGEGGALLGREPRDDAPAGGTFAPWGRPRRAPPWRRTPPRGGAVAAVGPTTTRPPDAPPAPPPPRRRGDVAAAFALGLGGAVVLAGSGSLVWGALRAAA